QRRSSARYATRRRVGRLGLCELADDVHQFGILDARQRALLGERQSFDLLVPVSSAWRAPTLARSPLMVARPWAGRRGWALPMLLPATASAVSCATSARRAMSSADEIRVGGQTWRSRLSPPAGGVSWASAP